MLRRVRDHYRPSGAFLESLGAAFHSSGPSGHGRAEASIETSGVVEPNRFHSRRPWIPFLR
jgi:hypothetical protein